MTIRGNSQQMIADILGMLADHIRNADTPASEFQKAVYEARTKHLVSRLSEALADGLLGEKDQKQGE